MLLAMSADEQATQLPDCPACEVVSSALEPVQVFVGSYPELLPFDFKQDLQHITELGDGLSKEALQCWNRTIFSSPEWGPIRVKAHVALEKMEWQSLLQPYVDEVLQACRRAT